jgi:hypothetical protein
MFGTIVLGLLLVVLLLGLGLLYSPPSSWIGRKDKED